MQAAKKPTPSALDVVDDVFSSPPSKSEFNVDEMFQMTTPSSFASPSTSAFSAGESTPAAEGGAAAPSSTAGMAAVVDDVFGDATFGGEGGKGGKA